MSKSNMTDKEVIFLLAIFLLIGLVAGGFGTGFLIRQVPSLVNADEPCCTEFKIMKEAYNIQTDIKDKYKYVADNCMKTIK